MRPIIEQREMPEYVPDFIENVPIVFDWVSYKGEDVFAVLNYPVSIRRGKATLDLAYCATQAMNGIFFTTKPFHKRYFQPSKLSEKKWE